MELWRKIWHRLGEHTFNFLLTYVPSHSVRLGALRLWGARIGHGSSVLRGTTILHLPGLSIGENCSVGMRCMLDARGIITIGDNVVIASDTHIIAGSHDVQSPDFAPYRMPILIEDFVWIASRSTILCGVTIGRGSVVSACSLVTGNVDDMKIVGGVPAKPLGERTSTLEYTGHWRPMFY